ncbi:MAG: FABP family protein [Candidatus Dormibacteraeota bacterium]|nr:FABP family protein [Candidatus Dormibacteraeota bacterium]
MAPPIHPDLGRLSALLGVWEGDGRGRAPNGAEFGYRETVRFDHSGKPFLSYIQRTTSTDDGRPLHTESGYWRAATSGDVELVLGHGSGYAEIEIGRWDGDVLRLSSRWLQDTPTAKHVSALQRDVEVDGDRLRYELRMSVDDNEPSYHLHAELRRQRV